MNRSSLRNNRLKFKSPGEPPNTSKDFKRIYLKLTKKYRKMSTCNQLDFGKHLDLVRLCPKTSPTFIHTEPPQMYVVVHSAGLLVQCFLGFRTLAFLHGPTKSPESINMWWNLLLCSTADMPQNMVG